jgi:glycine/D-amino acid oxidase-like deaminating enzyme
MPAPLRYVQDSADFPDAVDVVIIGAGIAGAAAAWELTRKGVKVALLEKGLVGAEQSSRNWGWCRQQNRDERELPLIIHALRRWGELDQETGEDLGFRRSGLIYATRNEADIAAWEMWNRMAKNYGVRSDILTGEQAKAATPGSTTRWLGGVSSPTDGHAAPPVSRARPGAWPRRVWRLQPSALARWCFSSARCAGWISPPGASAASGPSAA